MGQTKYNNYKKILEEYNYEICITFEEFAATNKISYKCETGHVTTLTTTSFQNKKTKTTDMRSLCTECFGELTKQLAFEEQKIKILNHTGHKLLRPLLDRKIEYVCGTCNSIQISTFSNLIKPTSTKYCSKCINHNTTKKTMDQVQLSLETLKIENTDLKNYEVLDYETNKNVTFKCNLNHTFTTSFFDLKKGRRCPVCAPEKRAETNLQRYGHSNVFASPKIKEKIKETTLKKFGETHHMKVEEIRNKAIQTNLQKIGVKYAFHTKESFEKIRATCLNRYGVEFPLQNKFIQAKITQTFLEKIGANRPMANQEYWKECLISLYGVDHYSKTDQFKIDYKQTCLDRYGVDHPMKTKEVFSRVMASSFRRKPFTFPSGRVDYVLGYEPAALEELLKTYDEADIITNVWCIPTFDYNRVSSKLRPIQNEAGSSSETTIKSRYFPDIMLPDKIIEVKSSYYYKNDKENVTRKMKACVRNGYSSELWVYKDEITLDFKILFFMKNEQLGYKIVK